MNKNVKLASKISIAMLSVSTLLSGSVLLSGCEDANQDGLTIIAGSEIKNIEPLLQDAEKKLGFKINLKYVGTIEGVDAVKTGGDYSVAWFGNAKYFYDTPESAKRIKLSEKIMFSPVIVGVKEAAVKANAIDPNKNYTWKDIASWVTEKHMTYAMTDPSVSNTGYVALMGVAYATANKGENLKIEDINPTVLKNFFKGQKVTAKSSSWLMDSFSADPNINFVINYESSILTNNENNPNNKLVPIYPVEGIVTSDYPMMLLDTAKTEKYKSLVAYLKSPEVQTQLVEKYKYHSVLPDVMAKQNVFNKDQLLVEMPFNPDNNLADAILTAYFNDYKKPAKFVFVVDTSGSMKNEREAMLKDTVNRLAKGELSKFAALRNRETVMVIPFSDNPYDVQMFDDKHAMDMAAYVNSLNMDGGTAMYDAVELAINKLEEEMKLHGKDYNYSVVVLTDGVTNTGHKYPEFEQWYKSQNLAKGDIRVFAISFGDADTKELNKMTSLTAGNTFESKNSLSATFREIRSYQ